MHRPASFPQAVLVGLAASGLAVALTVVLTSCSGADGAATSAAANSASAKVCGTTLELWEKSTRVGTDIDQLPDFLNSAVGDVSGNPVHVSQDHIDAANLQMVVSDLQSHPIPSCAGATPATYYAQLISDLKSEATALQQATSMSSYNTVNGYDKAILNDVDKLTQYLVLASYPTP